MNWLELEEAHQQAVKELGEARERIKYLEAVLLEEDSRDNDFLDPFPVEPVGD